MIIEIPDLPPSVNHYFKRSQNGRLYLDAEARAFVELAKICAKQAAKRARWKILPAGNFFYLVIGFEFKNKRFADPNNMLKILIDALEGIVFENDKWCCPMVVSAAITGRKHTKLNVITEFGGRKINE
ncbi:MAG TPA: RusA family crossover junction endodeoxyribonuclease [Rectinema sp.]|jgi:crossover junction endodeoxyribonuclease RusA|nr:MAG: Endodeoxyribonuclease RusA [Thermotogota bacterium ADurb.Bin062]HOF24585.1 RusA family crossover junction endodeoxyribonuclease [Thermotogota bacterium]HPB88506.1 RusA family crossover junction endodeoxyribonuclease [Thermotogota bacterium]HQL17262.1 RusA family crossover junction endodeoxyribonuclease [Rectinema sp.]